MPNPGIQDTENERRKCAVENALKAGAPPKGVTSRIGERSALWVASDEIGVAPRSMETWAFRVQGTQWEPDWSLWPGRPTPEKRLAEQGPLPGYMIKQVSENVDGTWIKQVKEHGEAFAVPDGHLVKGVSALLDPDGRTIQQWVKTGQDGDSIDWPAILRNAFAEFEGRAEPMPSPERTAEDCLNFLPCNDWHINMLSWKRQTGENWDLKTAERMIGDAAEAAIERTRRAGLAIVLGGGDLMHNDDNTNQTARSGHLLDVDSRHTKGMEAAQRIKVRTVDAALRYNDRVIVRMLKGNHDEHSSVAVAHFLAAWYRNEPRVTIDLDESLFWWFRFGKVLLGATHGHTVKLSKMPSIMAHRRAEDWGATKFRYAHGFHVHHREKLATEGEGVICESHQAPIPPDAWHYGSGYLSGRSIQSITYHRDRGEIGRAIEAVIGDAS